VIGRLANGHRAAVDSLVGSLRRCGTDFPNVLARLERDLVVVTTLDPHLQNAAEAAVREGLAAHPQAGQAALACRLGASSPRPLPRRPGAAGPGARATLPLCPALRSLGANPRKQRPPPPTPPPLLLNRVLLPLATTKGDV
jgi:hypothetical protein